VILLESNTMLRTGLPLALALDAAQFNSKTDKTDEGSAQFDGVIKLVESTGLQFEVHESVVTVFVDQGSKDPTSPIVVVARKPDNTSSESTCWSVVLKEKDSYGQIASTDTIGSNLENAVAIKLKHLLDGGKTA
jgi:hypothetical protein